MEKGASKRPGELTGEQPLAEAIVEMASEGVMCRGSSPGVGCPRLELCSVGMMPLLKRTWQRGTKVACLHRPVKGAAAWRFRAFNCTVQHRLDDAAQAPLCEGLYRYSIH